MSSQNTVVISVGGSVLKDLDINYLRKVTDMFNHLSSEYKLYVVVGGGETARRYIDICRAMGMNETYLDSVGIDATRLNSRVIIAGLKNVNFVPANTIDEAILLSKNYSIVVMGGISPGYTTDSVTVMIGECASAKRIVIATDVDGVYTADPKKDTNAKIIYKMTYNQLIDICSVCDVTAGSKSVIDPVAARLMARAKIPVYVVNGKNLEEFKKAIENKKFVGTVIR